MPESYAKRAARRRALGRMNLVAGRHGVLRADRDAGEDGLKALRRRLLLHLHPDKRAGGADAAMAADLREVNAAWDAYEALLRDLWPVATSGGSKYAPLGGRDVRLTLAGHSFKPPSNSVQSYWCVVGAGSTPQKTHRRPAPPWGGRSPPPPDA